MVSQADRLHQLAQARLQEGVAATLMALAATASLERIGDVRTAYAHATARTVAGGQWQAARLALAYVGAHVPFVREPDLPRALAGTLMTPDKPGAFVGLLRTWSRLDEGASELQARTEGGSLAADLAEGDLQAAQRDGLDEGADAAEREPRWAKLPNADACDWCREVSGADTGEPQYRYLAADTVPFHTSCKCAVVAQF